VLVVVGIVGGPAYSVATDRRHLRTSGFRVRSNAARRSPGVTTAPQVSGFNA
jgi:hypothetical protein